MNRSRNRSCLLIVCAPAIPGYAAAQQAGVQIAGAPCVTPPALHCPDNDCTPDRVINQGPVVEMKTRRTYFLDYPCDLKPDEKVTFVLSLHGAGSYGNWQRHYFPILDYKDRSSRIRIAKTAASSPTSSGSRKGTRRGSSQTSPKRS